MFLINQKLIMDARARSFYLTRVLTTNYLSRMSWIWRRHAFKIADPLKWKPIRNTKYGNIKNGNYFYLQRSREMKNNSYLLHKIKFLKIFSGKKTSTKTFSPMHYVIFLGSIFIFVQQSFGSVRFFYIRFNFFYLSLKNGRAR